jgi:hypothetical protein
MLFYCRWSSGHRTLPDPVQASAGTTLAPQYGEYEPWWPIPIAMPAMCSYYDNQGHMREETVHHPNFCL